MITRKEIEKRASACLTRHSRFVKPYACGSPLDPLFWFFWEKFGPEHSWKYILVMHTWWDSPGDVKNPGNLRSNVDHVAQCFAKDDGSAKALMKLFHTVNSQAIFQNGVALPVNAIWGAPTKEVFKITGGNTYLPLETYIDFMSVWVWIANEVQPEGGIRLLGKWDGWTDEGKLLDALASKTRIRWIHLPHPAAGSWRGLDFAQ